LSSSAPSRIVMRLEARARADPEATAVLAQGDSLSFAGLVERIERQAAGLHELGLVAGMRVAFMVPPGIDFLAALFALLRLGAVPVLIDAGMDLRGLRQCLEEAEPEAFLGSERAHLARERFGWGERTLRLRVVSDGRRADAVGLADLSAAAGPVPPPAPRAAEDPALILFTTGSTGPPKGVVYTDALLEAQHEALREVFGWCGGAVDMPTLPTFAPHALAAGATVAIPEMDFTRPGAVDAADLIGQIERHGATSVFGSPALLDRLARDGAGRAAQLGSVARVVTAGSPVAPATVERIVPLLAESGRLILLYGATEAIPVATIEGREVIAETGAAWAAGAGMCLGRPLGSVEAAAIAIDEEPHARWSPDMALPAGEIGELAVKGPAVSRGYVARPRADLLAKVLDPADGGIWHRSGDAVRFDELGRIWFQGRVGQRVRSGGRALHTNPVEAVFDQHPRVRRSALVGIGPAAAARPVVCVELEPGEEGRDLEEGLRGELLALAASHPDARQVRDLLRHPGLPVDIRHNSKVFRERLVPWVEERLAVAPSGGGMGRRAEITRAVFERFARGDPSFLEQVDPEVEVEVPPTLPGGGSFTGQRALLEFLDAMEEEFEGQEVDLEKFVDAGGEIVVLGRWRALARASGVSLDLPIAMRWAFRGELVVRYQSYIDTAAIQAAIRPGCRAAGARGQAAATSSNG